MKCDDVWPVLETGNSWQRWRARRHLERCPSCAKAAIRITQFKRQIAEPEPVSPELRMRWTGAMTVDSAVTLPVGRSRSKLVLAAVAAAAAAVVAIYLWPRNGANQTRPAPEFVKTQPVESTRLPAMQITKREPSSLPTVTVGVSPVQVKEIDVRKELARLRQDLARSETEIRKLADQAKLRRASAQLDLLLTKYGRN
jgi:hypothetical protein